MFRVLLPHLNGILSKRHPNEKARIQAHSSDPLLYSPPASAFVGAALGCLTTLYLSAFGMAPAIASALATALLCGQVLVIRTTGLLPGELFTSIYGGAFGGMTASLWRLAGAPFDQSYLEIGALWISLSLFCGLAFGIVAAIDSRSSRPIAFGYGGRSGAIAAIACFIYLQLASWTTGDELFRVADADQTDIDATSASLTCIACLMGTFATLLVLRRFDFKFDKIADRTFIASTVALFGLTALHLDGSERRIGCLLRRVLPGNVDARATEGTDRAVPRRRFAQRRTGTGQEAFARRWRQPWPRSFCHGVDARDPEADRVAACVSRSQHFAPESTDDFAPNAVGRCDHGDRSDSHARRRQSRRRT